MKITDRIAETKFTETEQSVANFIHNYPQRITQMTIRELAEATYTSNPTVVRVCQKLGYQGYRDFRLAMVKDVENEKYQSSDVNVSRPFYQSETPLDILNSMNNLYKTTVDAVTAAIDLEELNRIAGRMLKARRVFIYAIGDTRITTQQFMNKLVKLNLYLILATENYQELAETYNIDRNDYALFVTYKGMNDIFRTCADTLHNAEIPFALITGNAEGPMVPMCTEKVIIPDKEQKYKIAGFYSQISIGFILDMLYSLIYRNNYAAHHKHKDLLDSAS